MSEVAVLVNPVSGRGQGARLVEPVVSRLRTAGLQVATYTGRNASEAAEWAHQQVQRGVDALIVIGGDGLIHTAVQAVAGSGTTFGVVPAGTGNDFARALGIPRSDPLAATDLVIADRTRVLDLGRAGSRWFCTVLCAGIDSRVTERVSGMRWPRGRLRYDLATLAELRDLRPRRYSVLLDEGSEYGEFEVDGVLMAVGNTASYGSGQQICWGADPTDGRLDVIVAESMGIGEIVPLFLKLQRGAHLGHPKVARYRVRSVRMQSAGMTAWADGERVGSLPLNVQVHPAVLRVFAPGSG